MHDSPITDSSAICAAAPICPRCGAPTHCTAAHAPQHCWCMTEPVRAPLPSSTDARCFCRNCLRELALDIS